MEDKKAVFGNKLLFHPLFRETVDALNKLKIKLPPNPDVENLDLSLFPYPRDGKLVSNVEKIGVYGLDAAAGSEFLKEFPRVAAYDESFQKYQALEGMAQLTSHALIVHSGTEYVPSCMLTFYFYTRASQLTQEAPAITFSDEPEQRAKRDYVLDRNEFIIDNVPNNCICFIDGPLVGGQVTSYTNKLNKELLSKGVIPIFFVKNSNSNMVVDNLEGARGTYNSDLHWANSVMKEGTRSNFFVYTDQYVSENSKAFAYLKAYQNSTQRVEIHTRTYQKHKDIIPEIMDLAYYLLLVQGNPKNPQVRSIAIAEMYARECLSLVNMNELVKNARLQATINETRFGRS